MGFAEKNAETTDYKNDVEKQVNYYYGINTDGFSGTGVYLRSGIGIMKYVHPDDTNRKEIKAKAEPAIRFAEILLIYAEALNELEDGSSYDIPSWDGSTSYSVKRDVDEMKKASDKYVAVRVYPIIQCQSTRTGMYSVRN